MRRLNISRQRLIILDRDGVINYESPLYIKTPDEWHPIPGSIEAIGRLSQSGYQIVIATNQSGVGRGLYSIDTLSDIHQKMMTLIETAGGHIDRIYFCPHHPDDGCDCRKPQPGLLKKIFSDYGVSESECLFIGDSLQDVGAAKAVGCSFLLLKTGNGLKTLSQLEDVTDILIANDLSEAVDWIISNR